MTTTTHPTTRTDDNPTLASWRQHAAPFTAVVVAVTDWDAASPCEGWTATDVVDHVVQTERDFVEGRGLSLPVTAGGSPADRWAAHETAVAALLADPAVGGQAFDGHFGPTTVGATLTRFYGFDLLVHRWDISRSQGRDEVLTDAELDEIDAAVDGFGEHAYAPGIFARPVEVPEGADRCARVLGRTGRRA